MLELLGTLLVILIVGALLARFFLDALSLPVDMVGGALERRAGTTPTHSFRTAIVTRAFDPETLEGKVRADGTIWTARCTPDDARHLEVGDEVHVEDVEGLKVQVRRLDSPTDPSSR